MAQAEISEAALSERDSLGDFSHFSDELSERGVDDDARAAPLPPPPLAPPPAPAGPPLVDPQIRERSEMLSHCLAPTPRGTPPPFINLRTPLETVPCSTACMTHSWLRIAHLCADKMRSPTATLRYLYGA
jgi:hypothetical protein